MRVGVPIVILREAEDLLFHINSLPNFWRLAPGA
jgi:hypothetical protein